MHTLDSITLKDVQEVYSSWGGDLWELIMGEQIHLGGFDSSLCLADRAGIQAGQHGVDLCCCTGAGMRFLIQIRHVARMTGIDATARVLKLGRDRCAELGLTDRVTFVQADVEASGVATGEADFVWGEDAWCYVEDKAQLLTEAVRLVKPGGTIAFTDWVEGPTGLSVDEANHFLGFMKFPSLQTIEGYRAALSERSCTVEIAEDTGRFAPCMDLYLEMLTRQLTYDALRILKFDRNVFRQLGTELQFIQQLAHAGKIAQGMFVARKE